MINILDSNLTFIPGLQNRDKTKKPVNTRGVTDLYWLVGGAGWGRQTLTSWEGGGSGRTDMHQVACEGVRRGRPVQAGGVRTDMDHHHLCGRLGGTE